MEPFTVDRLWRVFHKLWGNASGGHYDKRLWSDFHEVLLLLVKLAGLERRRSRLGAEDAEDRAAPLRLIERRRDHDGR